MTGENIGAHMVRSLETAHEKIAEAAKTKTGKELNDAATDLEAELDRLLQLMRGS